MIEAQEQLHNLRELELRLREALEQDHSSVAATRLQELLCEVQARITEIEDYLK